MEATDADSQDSVTYEITGGVDGPLFTIGETTGVLTFKTAPNFEDPQDALSVTPPNTLVNNEYVLVVTATGGSGTRAKTATQTIVVTVTNVDEPGTVAFEPSIAEVGTAVQAEVVDTDRGVTSVTWQWAKSDTKTGTYADISGETSASYTPVTADVGKWLRATASYTDTLGSGKSAAGIMSQAVRSGQPALTARPRRPD